MIKNMIEEMIRVKNLLFLRNSIYFFVIEIFKRYGKNWEVKYAYNKQIKAKKYNDLNDRDRKCYINRVREFADGCGCIMPEKDELIKDLCSRGLTYSWELRKNIAEEDVEIISNHIKQFKLQQDILVYRGVGRPTMEWMLKEAERFDGIDLYDKGFLFTTLTKATLPKRPYYLRILLPKGTNAFYSGDVNFEEEVYQEIVVQRDAKLKIVSLGIKYINCVLVIEKNTIGIV